MLTPVMLRLCINELIYQLANYIFINFKTSYLSAQRSDFDDLYIKIINRIPGFHFKVNITTSTSTENVHF